MRPVRWRVCFRWPKTGPISEFKWIAGGVGLGFVFAVLIGAVAGALGVTHVPPIISLTINVVPLILGRYLRKQAYIRMR